MINHLWNGKLNDKWENGDRDISEILKNKRHGPTRVYYFNGKVKMSYYSNGEQIFLL